MVDPQFDANGAKSFVSTVPDYVKVGEMSMQEHGCRLIDGRIV